MPSSGQRSNGTHHEKINSNPSYPLMPSGQSPTHNTGTSDNNDDQEPGTNEPAHTYDWDRNVKAANARLQSAGLQYLPIEKVGRVVEGRKTVSVYNVDKKGAKYFISYDGTNVYACIPELHMKDTLIYQNAALYVGMLNHMSHPEDVDLETQYHGMKDGSIAIHIYPKAGVFAKKTRS